MPFRRSPARSRTPDEPWIPGPLRLVLGLAIVPAITGLGRTLLDAITDVPGPSRILSLDAGVFAFVVGFCGFSLAFVFLPRPTRMYIWAHELTHALFAWLQGARVRNLRVQDDRGSVLISRTHLLTLLAPYFFPLYSVLLTLVLAGLSLWVPLARLRIPGLALLGLSWGFHVCFTINSMAQHQTDIERCGYVFSYAWIVFLNLVVLAAGLLVVTPFSEKLFLSLWQDHTVQSYDSFWDWMFRQIRRLTRFATSVFRR